MQYYVQSDFLRLKDRCPGRSTINLYIGIDQKCHTKAFLGSFRTPEYIFCHIDGIKSTKVISNTGILMPTDFKKMTYASFRVLKIP